MAVVKTSLFEARHSAAARSVPAVNDVQENAWGWLPALSVVGAAGLLLVALADVNARAGLSGGTALFWIGLMTLFVPIALRLIAANVLRRERIGLVLVLGLGLYLVKLLHSPLGFSLHDEFIHWRTAQDIVDTGHLFHENPLITVSPYFPGLQLVTAAVMQLSGLEAYPAGILVIGVGRLVLLLSLYLLFREVGQSDRIAGVATLLYMANPNFLFFISQYAYESLALPCAVLTLYLAVRRSRAPEHRRLWFNLALVLSLAVVTVTHHLTSYALLAFLSLWTLVPIGLRLARAFGRWIAQQPAEQAAATAAEADPQALPQRKHSGPGHIVLLAIVLNLAWLIYVAPLVISYLAPVLNAALSELLSLLLGDLPSRQLFRDYAGQRPPLWEQLSGYGSVLLILAALPFGISYIWRQYRNNSLAITLSIGAMAYPAALALRLTQAGAETSNRSSEFLFVPIAFVLAVGMSNLWSSLRWSWFRPLVFTVWASIVFLGGTIVGTPPWTRLPAGYLVSADSRSIEPQSINAALWANEQLGPDNRVGADRINRLLMASYGLQRVVTNLSEGVNVAYVYFAEQVGATERMILERADVEYLVVDDRLSTGLPLAGVYFEGSEPDSGRHRTPIATDVLEKFDALPQVSRVFDSGDISIYDVGALSDEP